LGFAIEKWALGYTGGWKGFGVFSWVGDQACGWAGDGYVIVYVGDRVGR
jgi:hypothetical protein